MVKLPDKISLRHRGKVQFTEISEEGKTRLLTMVKALGQARQGN